MVAFARTFAMGALGALAMIGFAAATPAAAQFNIEEPEAEKGEIEIEYHGAYHSGIPRRRFIVEDPGGPDEEIVGDKNEAVRHGHELEVNLGITDYFKLGVCVEFEKERLEEIDDLEQLNAFDSLKATEIEIQGTFVFVPLKKNGFGLAALVGFSHAFEAEEGNTFKIGPLMKVANGPWSATGNLIFVKHFGGGEFEDGVRVRDERWDLDYAWQLKYDLSKSIGLAVEGYGSFNRLGDSGTRDEGSLLFGDGDTHRIGPVVYYTFGLDRGRGEKAMKLGRMNAGKGKDDDDKKGGKDDDDDDDEEEGPSARIGAGVLFGLNDNTSDVALKWNVEVTF